MNSILDYQKQIPNFKLNGCMFSNSNSYITTAYNYIKLIQTMHRQSVSFFFFFFFLKSTKREKVETINTCHRDYKRRRERNSSVRGAGLSQKTSLLCTHIYSPKKKKKKKFSMNNVMNN